MPAAVAQYHAFFARVMWRSARADVADQLQLPQQHSHLVALKFSDVEAYYYKEQHAEVKVAAQDLLRRYVDEPDHIVLLNHKWVQPFLRLRQACCHYQIGQSGRALLNRPGATAEVYTMAELLQRLLSKAKLDAEDAQKDMLAATNGLAGVMVLKHEPAAAVGLYKEVLEITTANQAESGLKPDSFQLVGMARTHRQSSA